MSSTFCEAIKVDKIIWLRSNPTWILIDFEEEKRKLVIMRINKMLKGW